jgi:hypothetical protein
VISPLRLEATRCHTTTVRVSTVRESLQAIRTKSSHTMHYKFRMTFHHATPGVLRFDSQSVPLAFGNAEQFELRARNADTLAEATAFHIEGTGFPDKASAEAAGERLRVRLRLWNAMLGLGIKVPLTDTVSGGASSHLKQKLLEDHDAVAVQNVMGLNVYPDDDRHIEVIFSAEGQAHPSSSEYLLDALEQLWPIDVAFNDQTEDALNIINAATVETSARARFLTTYLALEQLIERSHRSSEALELLEELQSILRNAKLEEHEAESLSSSLANLRLTAAKIEATHSLLPLAPNCLIPVGIPNPLLHNRLILSETFGRQPLEPPSQEKVRPELSAR